MSFGEDAAFAPSATNWSTASLRVSNTVSWCLASIRRRAIGKPILPRPINPISIFLVSFLVLARREATTRYTSRVVLRVDGDVTGSPAASHAFVLCVFRVWEPASAGCLIAAAVLG